MAKKRKIPTIVKLSILTAITVIVWVGFEIYRAFTSSPSPIVAPEILSPVDPTLDAVQLDRLQKRIHLTEDEIADTAIVNLEEEVEINE